MPSALAQAEALRRRSRFREALVFYKRALRTVQDEERLAVLIAMGDTYRMVGAFPKAVTAYEESVSLAKEVKEPSVATDAAVGLGLAKRALGDWKGALVLLRRAEKSYRKADDQEGEAFALWAQAGALRIRGEIPAAVETFSDARRIFADLGHRTGVGYCLCGLGGTTRVRGHFKRSLKHYTDAHGLFTELKDTFGRAYSHCGMGNAHRMLGDLDAARDHFTRATVLYRRIGDVVSYAYTLWSMGKTHSLIGNVALADKFYSDALGLFRKTRDPRGIIYCRLGAAELRVMGGHPNVGARLLNTARAEADKHGFLVERCHAEALLSALQGRTDRVCYRRLGLKLRFDFIPFNIP